MSTAKFAEKRAADANPPVPICLTLWDEEALSNSCPSARFDVLRELMTSVRSAAECHEQRVSELDFPPGQQSKHGTFNRRLAVVSNRDGPSLLTG
jgi:hypothetical protein